MPLKPKTKFIAARYGELTGTILLLLTEGAATQMVGGVGNRYQRKRLYDAFDCYSREQMKRAVARLRIAKLVRFDPKDETDSIIVTKHGLQRATIYRIRRAHLNQPQRWDHYYRLCIFDIPDWKNKRRRFQTKLRALGWFRLQDSVYVHPHDREEEIELLAKQFRITDDVLTLTVASLGPFEERVRNFFFKK